MSTAAGMEERFTAHRGRRLRYLIGGTGPGMLLCHGFIGSAENFDDWYAELLQRRTLVVPDLPGNGFSMPLAALHDADSMAEAALSAADDAGLRDYDLAGLCLGAGVALAVRRLRAPEVRRVILHTPLLNPRLVRRRFHLQLGLMMSRLVYPTIVWLGRQRVTSDLYKRFMVEGDSVDPDAAQANFDNQLRANPRASREWLLDGLSRDDVAALADSHHRMLILVAAEDRIVDGPRIARTLAGNPNIAVALIDDAGHGWTATYVRRQLELITAFLDDQPLPLPSTEAA